MAIQLTSLDDASKVTPQMVFFTKHAQPWDLVDATLAKFPGNPPM